ncbi:MAG: class F sortase [Anaerolineales bacterium]
MESHWLPNGERTIKRKIIVTKVQRMPAWSHGCNRHYRGCGRRRAIRGGGIPGDIGTATIAGHVNDPLGRPEIFARLEDLRPGDLIIIHLKNTTMDIRFTVDEVKLYTVKESSDPAVLTRIYGAGPVAGTAPQPAPDGLSHLTLITCAGDIVGGLFNAHTVIYATRSK